MDIVLKTPDGRFNYRVCAVIVHEGKLLLGSSQGVFFLEFDGPRSRKCQVKVVAD